MGVYVVVVAVIVNAESEISAKQEADAQICQSGRGDWICKVLGVNKEPEQ